MGRLGVNMDTEDLIDFKALPSPFRDIRCIKTVAATPLGSGIQNLAYDAHGLFLMEISDISHARLVWGSDWNHVNHCNTSSLVAGQTLYTWEYVGHG